MIAITNYYYCWNKNSREKYLYNIIKCQQQFTTYDRSDTSIVDNNHFNICVLFMTDTNLSNLIS